MRRMRTLPSSFVLFVIALLGADTTRSQPANRFEVQKVADGVFAAIRTEPPGLMFDANSIFIIGPDDVIVVDTNVTPSSASATLAALKALTSKPVTTVVNTHWHDDHIMGNATYRAAFPKAQFVGHVTSADDLRTTGAANRKQLLQAGPQMVQQIRVAIEQKKSLGGAELTEEERKSYESDVAAAERFFAEAPTVDVIAPTVTVKDKLVFKQGARTIEVLHLGAGHTAADLVVHLPAERILITGDLVVHPIPLVGSTSLPSQFAGTLEKLIALKPAVIVPGHGPVMRDDTYARRELRLLTALVSQVKANAGKATTPPEMRKLVNLTDLRREFAGDSQLLGVIFDFYVTQPGIAAAMREK